MPNFVIERDIPNVGQLSREQLEAISQKSCEVLGDLGPRIQWVHSYVTANKIYCVYRSSDADLIREHAERGGFPANKIEEVFAMIDPTTADARRMTV
ncbi:MAG TPA: DUF4242 domain-containing protein [Gemmatimonadales bacterium]|nr:DUF4242 domain-containing protein [Gemmatimonadales bacterium]